MSLNTKIIKLIEDYQQNKPPSTVGKCVHYPTCSAYAKECYQKFGFLKATFLSGKRVLFCTPFNKKVYDPVPLTKVEKKIDKDLYLKALPIKDILLAHYNKYPLMQLQDYLKLIYQNSFGAFHMQEISIEKIKEYLDIELKDVTSTTSYIEDIGNGYKRFYLYQGMDIDKISTEFHQLTLNNTNNEETVRVFYRKINILNKLIKQNKIKIYDEQHKRMKKKDISIKIRIYLQDGFKPLHHSKIYNDSYKPHYRLLKAL